MLSELRVLCAARDLVACKHHGTNRANGSSFAAKLTELDVQKKDAARKIALAGRRRKCERIRRNAAQPASASTCSQFTRLSNQASRYFGRAFR
jgi:hypothetical protein